jgi:sugar phosphate isomerase/epimerase
VRERLLLPHYSMIPASFEERLEAAVAGGFGRLGMSTGVWQRARAEGRSDADLAAMLDHAGVRLSQVESFGMPGLAQQDEFASAVDDALRMAETFGCDEFFVVGRDGVAFAEHVELFGWLCDRAGDVGLRVGLEFMTIPGISGYADADAAMALVRAVDRPNAGVAVDTFHHFRGSADWEQLERIPGERVVVLQVNDAMAAPVGDGYIDETMHHRMVPGEGALPLVEFLQLMDRLGATCAYSIEVLSAELSALPPAEVGRRLGEGARNVLRAAGLAS